ncbi:MAG: hypothetical protein FJ026_05255 [Chloroflexi bacterium]|nr:hypothetical protein [Chloroflexota bacterium]
MTDYVVALWARRRTRWMALGTIVLLGLITYAPNLSQLGLYGDDWRNLSEIAFDGSLYPSGFRPIGLGVWNAGAKVFGLNVQAYLWTGVALYLFSVVLLYFVLVALLPRSYEHLGLLSALLFLTYPSNYSHTWVTLWPSGGLVCLVMTGTLFFILFLQHYRGWQWLLSLLLLALSLNWYELQIGLIAGVPLLGTRDLIRGSVRRRLMVLSPSILAIAIAVWWLVEHSAFVGERLAGTTTSWADFPSQLLPRLWLSYRTLLMGSWTGPIRSLLASYSRFHVALALVIAVVSNIVLYRVVARLFRHRLERDIPLNWEAILNQKWARGGILASFAAIGLGILPILPLGSPWISTLDSRVTLFASMGAATCIVLSTYLVAAIITKSRKRALLFVSLSVAILLTVAVPSQWAAQQGLAAAWRLQRCVWFSMLDQVPSFADGTWIYIVDVPAQEGLWDVPPFVSLPSEVSAAIRLLYNNRTLQGGFTNLDEEAHWGVNGVRLTQEGLKPRFSDQIVPYDQLVMFRYHSGGSLELLDVTPANLPGSASSVPLTTWRILANRSDSPYRFLIEPRPVCSLVE